MGKNYSHLTLDERCQFGAYLEMGLSKKEIARRLGCHRATVYRELDRNTNADGNYNPSTASARATARKPRGSMIERSSELKSHVEDRLVMGWSPEQISARLELDASEHRLSHETIYRYVYSSVGRKSRLHRFLAQRKSRRGRHRRYEYKGPRAFRVQTESSNGSNLLICRASCAVNRTHLTAKRSNIPDRVPISERPPEIEGREEFGHWEADLMLFSRTSDILLTLTERQTRLTLVHRLFSKRADETADAIADCLKSLPADARKTITFDNGGEFSPHTRLKDKIGIQSYFCDPHSPSFGTRMAARIN